MGRSKLTGKSHPGKNFNITVTLGNLEMDFPCDSKKLLISFKQGHLRSVLTTEKGTNGTTGGHKCSQVKDISLFSRLFPVVFVYLAKHDQFVGSFDLNPN